MIACETGSNNGINKRATAPVNNLSGNPDKRARKRNTVTDYSQTGQRLRTQHEPARDNDGSEEEDKENESDARDDEGGNGAG